jgi:hypothetical protein
MLRKFINRTSSPLENELVNAWLNVGANKDIFYQHMLEWERDNLSFIPEENLALEKLLKRIDSNTDTDK